MISMMYLAKTCTAFSTSKSSFLSKPLQHTSSSHTATGRPQSSTKLSMGLEIKIRIVGRKNGSEKWIEDAYKMYDTRLTANIDVETIWHKNNDDLTKNVLGDAEKGHAVVLLDPTGKIGTSEKFSDDVYDWLDEGGSRLSFVIGGAEGLPVELKHDKGGNKGGSGGRSRFQLFSLSTLTFTHQFARVLLIEQIYRASEIRKGSGYHK